MCRPFLFVCFFRWVMVAPCIIHFGIVESVRSLGQEQKRPAQCVGWCMNNSVRNFHVKLRKNECSMINITVPKEVWLDQLVGSPRSTTWSLSASMVIPSTLLQKGRGGEFGENSFFKWLSANPFPAFAVLGAFETRFSSVYTKVQAVNVVVVGAAWLEIHVIPNTAECAQKNDPSHWRVVSVAPPCAQLRNCNTYCSGVCGWSRSRYRSYALLAAKADHPLDHRIQNATVTKS